jgi:hypothetical protein
MTELAKIPHDQVQRAKWRAEAARIASELKQVPDWNGKDQIRAGIVFDDRIVKLTLETDFIERTAENALAEFLYYAVLATVDPKPAAQQAPCIARSDSPEGHSHKEGPTPAASLGNEAGPPGKSTDGEHRLPAQPAGAAATERCMVKNGEEQCPNQAVGGLRVNLHAAPAIQKRYGRRVMLSLIFDLPVCLACMSKLTPDNLMTEEQWRAFSKVAQQRNSGVLTDRAQTEIMLCQFEEPEYVALRQQIARRAAANDLQPAPAGPQPEGDGDGSRSRSEHGW